MKERRRRFLLSLAWLSFCPAYIAAVCIILIFRIHPVIG